MKHLAYSLIVIFVLGLLLFGAVVCVASAVQYFGSFEGIVGFTALALYVIAVGIPVVIALHLLGLKMT